MAIMAFFALNQRSLCNERCKKVQNEISLKAIDAKEKKILTLSSASCRKLSASSNFPMCMYAMAWPLSNMTVGVYLSESS